MAFPQGPKRRWPIETTCFRYWISIHATISRKLIVFIRGFTGHCFGNGSTQSAGNEEEREERGGSSTSSTDNKYSSEGRDRPGERVYNSIQVIPIPASIIVLFTHLTHIHLWISSGIYEWGKLKALPEGCDKNNATSIVGRQYHLITTMHNVCNNIKDNGCTRSSTQEKRRVAQDVMNHVHVFPGGDAIF